MHHQSRQIYQIHLYLPEIFGFRMLGENDQVVSGPAFEYQLEKSRCTRVLSRAMYEEIHFGTFA